MTEQEIIYTMALTRVPRVNTAAQHRLMEEAGSASCSTTAITSVTFIPKLRTSCLPHCKKWKSKWHGLKKNLNSPGNTISNVCATTTRTILHDCGNATTLPYCFTTKETPT